MNSSENNPVILFDGVCNYCNSWVNFYIRHDKKNKLRFAPLQSEKGKELLEKYNFNSSELNSVVLIENNKAYIKSSAGLRPFKYLNGIYPIAIALLIVPAFIRNFFYGIIASNRYKWWGRREVCMIPTEEIKNKFLIL